MVFSSEFTPLPEQLRVNNDAPAKPTVAPILPSSGDEADQHRVDEAMSAIRGVSKDGAVDPGLGL